MDNINYYRYKSIQVLIISETKDKTIKENKKESNNRKNEFDFKDNSFYMFVCSK